MAEWGEGGVFEGEGHNSYTSYTTHTDIIVYSVNIYYFTNTANISHTTSLYYRDSRRRFQLLA